MGNKARGRAGCYKVVTAEAMEAVARAVAREAVARAEAMDSP